MIVNLYERMSARSADRLLASVTEVDGDRISLPAGRTLNLLIELNEGGGLSIRMEIPLGMKYTNGIFGNHKRTNDERTWK